MTPNSRMPESLPCSRRFRIHTITATQGGLSEQQPSLLRAGMGYDNPIVTQLRPWDRFCPQVLQSSVQHKITNIWPDENPIFCFLRGRAGDSCGCSGDVEVMVHLNSESIGSISEGRGHIEIERWFSTHQLVSYASQGIGCYMRFTSKNRRHSQEGSKYGKQSLKT